MKDLEKVQKTLSDVFDYLNGNNLQLVGKELLTEVGDAHRIVENLAIHGVIHCPDELEPVLAKIEHTNDLGLSKWYEVVYFDGNWRSYSGSKTFEDGEKVVKWTYCKGCV